MKKSSGTLYWGESFTGGPLQETDLGGTKTADYVYFNGKRVARVDANNLIHYYLSDHLGSTSIVANSAGTVENDSDYFPFGGERVVTNAGANHFKFTGKERDTESGLDYFGARHYSSTMGRFMSPDPLLNSGRPDNPQTWNRYTYALNNPLVITDPTGLYNLINNCGGDDSKCNKAFAQDAKNLKNGISALTDAVNGLKDGDQKTALQASLKALGTENDGNNVGVQFGKNADGASGNTTLSVDASGKMSFTLRFDSSQNQGMVSQAISAAHEGTHVAEISDPRFADNATTLSPFSLEYRGYRTSAYAASALGQSAISFGRKGQYLIWNGSWGAVDRNLTRYIPTLDKPGHVDHQETTPHDPWSNK